MKGVLFFLVLAVALVSAQTTVRRIIDDFSVGTAVQSVSLTLDNDLTTSDTPVTRSSSLEQSGCSGLVGCSRDMIIRASSGGRGRTFTSNIFTNSASFNVPGEWSVSTPKGCSAVSTIQYDGGDGSGSLNTSGLGGIDLTDNGLGLAFRLSITSDLQVPVTINIYSPNGNVCTGTVEAPILPGTYAEVDTLVFKTFTSFTGNCDFKNTGAIEILVSSLDAIDIIFRSFAIVGSGDPSASVTPSPQVNPSNSPSASPSPSGVQGFTWYTFDDDDERSPCGDEQPQRTYWVSDDNIIYYYFYGANGGVEVSSESSANTLVAGFALLAGLLMI